MRSQHMTYDVPFWPATLFYKKLVDGLSIHIHMDMQAGYTAATAIKLAHDMCNDTLLTIDPEYRKYIDYRYGASLALACYSIVKEACSQINMDSSCLEIRRAADVEAITDKS